jgi:hypothetical protein
MGCLCRMFREETFVRIHVFFKAESSFNDLEEPP